MGDKKKKKEMKDFTDFAAMWGWPADKDERKKQWKEFRANMETLFDQLQDIQKTYVEAKKEAWNKVFPKLMGIQDKFAESLPEKMPTPPGMPESPVSPKEVAGKVKEFQKMANKYAVEQADAVIDFAKKGQEQVKSAVTEAVDKIEKNAEETEE